MLKPLWKSFLSDEKKNSKKQKVSIAICNSSDDKGVKHSFYVRVSASLIPSLIKPLHAD